MFFVFSKDKGQGTLEMTVALVLVMLLIVGAVRIFVWLNERMVYRQVDYENTRAAAGSVPISTEEVDLMNQEQTMGVQVDESLYPALNVFK